MPCFHCFAQQTAAINRMSGKLLSGALITRSGADGCTWAVAYPINECKSAWISQETLK